ncbi:MAG: hypothetical protein U0271_40390 [Polyangiaceae bacterium]
MIEITNEEKRAVLGALRAVAEANGEFDELERTGLATVAELLGDAVDPARVEVSSPEAFGQALRGFAHKEDVIHALTLMAIIDGDISESEVAIVKRYAAAVGVDDAFVKDLDHLVRGHLNLVRLDVARRMPLMEDAVKELWRTRGARGLYDLLQSFRGKHEDPEVAWRFKRLGLLPEGTLGRAFWAHMTREGFAFPGERGGLAEFAAHHDVTHVLTGYLTDPSGESEVAAFYAGMLGQRAFPLVFGTTLMFQVGLKLSPIVTPARRAVDPQKLLRAYERGTRVTTKLWIDWDFWPLMERPIDEARAAVGLV